MSLKVGIVGAGGMARYHIEGIRAAGGEIVAIADVNAAAAAASAARFGIPRHFGRVARLLEERGLQAVTIVTPNRYHRPLALQALAAGKHVFCEKPPALNARETREMAAAAKKARRMLMFDFNNRARPEAYAMRDYLRRGVAGRIHSAQALWIRRTGIPGFGGWFTNKALSGGGPVIDLLHMMDLALHFMGCPEPRHVLAQTFDDFISDRSFKGPWGIPDVARGVTNVESACHGFIRFAEGQVLFVRSSWAEMNRREEVSVTFQGTKAGGMVRRLFGRDGIDDTSVDACELYVQENGRSVNREIAVEPDPTMGRVRAAVNFVGAVNGTEEPLNTPDEAVRLMTIVDALYESSSKGRPVTIR